MLVLQQNYYNKAQKLALASLETRLFFIDHIDLATTTHNLGARLILQRPKGITDLHRALLSIMRVLHCERIAHNRQL